MDLKAKALEFPAKPGVYLMKDGAGKVLYVGKAISLKARVRTYFREGADGRPQIPLLMERVREMEFIVTESEKAALFLEKVLITRHRPKFNVDLRDDKNYYSLRIAIKDPFPRLMMVRRVKNDGALYFGPYSSAGDLRETVDLLHKVFGLRHCSDRDLVTRKRPCLYRVTRNCPAPCQKLISEADYHRTINEVILFLKGKNKELAKRIKKEMEDYAANEEFERAAAALNRLRAVEATLQKQGVVVHGGGDRDAVGWVREGDEALAAVVSVRAGKVIDSRGYFLRGVIEEDGEVFGEFLRRYYGGERITPPEILVAVSLGDETGPLQEWLTEKCGKKVSIIKPQRGALLSLVKMANENAGHLINERRKSKVGFESALGELQNRLSLPSPPRRVECFDISNTQSFSPVASMASFLDGFPDKDRYRRFSIKNVSGQDDFAMMAEVIGRRFSHSGEGWERPDLVVIDGGPQQLEAALKALVDSGAGDIPIIGLAKSRLLEGAEGIRSPERIFFPGKKAPLVLAQNSPALFLLMRIRDEAHRFAVEYHRKKRKSSTLRSALDSVAGIGPAKKKALLARFKSVKAMREAGAGELSTVEGINEALAEKIMAALTAAK